MLCHQKIWQKALQHSSMSILKSRGERTHPHREPVDIYKFGENMAIYRNPQLSVSQEVKISNRSW